VLLAIVAQPALGIGRLRTRRVTADVTVSASSPAPAPVAKDTEEDGLTVTDSEESDKMVMAEMKSEADEITEDGSNDDSAELDADDGRAPDTPIHEHFRQFTAPMPLLPTEQSALLESESESESESGHLAQGEAQAKSGLESESESESESETETESASESVSSSSSTSKTGEDEGKGSNPTYILPVDPFNYFPFFNGFSNVNPFSQFYPPPPYLYPQYTNYMHRYASHGIGHATSYPYPGAAGGAMGHHGFGRGGFPYNYPHPNPHMHYPFGAYKLDVSGPDVRTGENNPPPFPQFAEVSSKLITPEIIPKANADEDTSPTVIAEIEMGDEAEDEADIDIEHVDEDEGEAEGEAQTETEIEDEVMGEDHDSTDAEIVDEAADEGEVQMVDADMDEGEDEAEDSEELEDVLEFEDGNGEEEEQEMTNDVEYA